MDVDKAGLVDAFAQKILGHGVERSRRAQPPAAFFENVCPLARSCVRCDGVVVRPYGDVDVKHLDPAARLQHPVRILEQLRPVFDTAGKPADVYVVHGIRTKSPRLVQVFNLAIMESN